MNESNILLYEIDEGKINVDVILKDETIWLTQKSMSELFAKYQLNNMILFEYRTKVVIGNIN